MNYETSSKKASSVDERGGDAMWQTYLAAKGKAETDLTYVNYKLIVKVVLKS